MNQSRRSLLISLSIGFVITVAVLFISEWLIDQDLQIHQQQYENQVEGRIDFISNKLQQEINSNLIVIEAVESLLLLNSDITGQQFDTLAATLIKTRPSIQQIQLSPGAVIKYIYPLAGNESVLGLNLRKIPGQNEVVERSIQNAETIMAGPLDLIQGGEGVIVRKPLYIYEERKKQFWGFITLIIDVPRLYQATGLKQQDELTHYALRGRDATGAQGETFFGNAQLFGSHSTSRAIRIPGGSWQLTASLTAGQHQLHEHSMLLLSLWGVIAALAFGALSSGFTYIWLKLYREATHDALSSLLNRQHFQDLAESEIQRAQRYNFTLAVIMIDLDYFKQINDQHGHQMGDMVIRETARLINQVVRDSDRVGRYGGEEFVVLVPHSGAQRAIQCAHRIHRNLQRQRVIDGEALNLSASLGVATLSEEADSYHKLVSLADKALYEAKKRGRNQVVLAETDGKLVTSAQAATST